MQKLKAFFYVLKQSITAPLTGSDYYADLLANASVWFSIKYFFVLAFFAFVTTSVFVIAPVVPEIQKFSDNLFAGVAQIYPADLVIKASGGELSINQPEPYIIPMPKEAFGGISIADSAETDEDIELAKLPTNLLVFDSEGTLDDLDTYDTLFLVNKTNILGRNTGKGKIEVVPLKEMLKDLTDTEFGKKDVDKIIEAARPFFAALPYVFFVVALVFMAIYNFGFRLVGLLIVALVLLVFGRLRGFNYKFGQYYKIGIHAITIPLLLEIVFSLVRYNPPVGAWAFWANILLGIFILVRVNAAGGKTDKAGNLPDTVPSDTSTGV